MSNAQVRPGFRNGLNHAAKFKARDYNFRGLSEYPALPALIALIAGILITWCFGPVDESVLLWLLLCAPAGVIYGLRRRNKAALVFAVGALFMFLGCFLSARELLIGAHYAPPPDRLIIHCTVTDKLGASRQRRVLLVDSGVAVRDGTALPGRGRLVLKGCGLPLCAGDRIAFRSRITLPENKGNPGEFDWELYCRNSGIAWLAHVQGEDSVVLISRGSRFRVRALLDGLRERIEQFLDAHFRRGSAHDEGIATRSDIGAIVKGIVLGDRAEISPALNKSFVDSGTVHILSASGLHVGIVAFAAVAAVRLLTWPFPFLYVWVPVKKLAAMASIPSIVVYCLLVGARAATVRSTIMGLVVAAALITDRKWGSWNSLYIAALAILLVYPLSLYAVDFQLSFAAVAAIFIVLSASAGFFSRSSPRRSGPPARLRRLRDLCVQWTCGALLVSGAAGLGVLPILLWVFHSIPVYSVLANLAAVPLFSLALPLSLVGCFIGMWSPWAGGLLLWPAEHSIRFAVRWQTLIAGLPGSTLQVPDVSLLLGTTVVGICIAAARLLLPARGLAIQTVTATGPNRGLIPVDEGVAASSGTAFAYLSGPFRKFGRGFSGSGRPSQQEDLSASSADNSSPENVRPNLGKVVLSAALLKFGNVFGKVIDGPAGTPASAKPVTYALQGVLGVSCGLTKRSVVFFRRILRAFWAFLLRGKVATPTGVLFTTYGALVASMLIIWLAGQASLWFRSTLRVTFLNVGKADAAFVEFPGGARMLVDAGRRMEDYDAGARYVLPALRWTAVRSLDWVMASHPDMDHTGGMLAVIKEIPTRALLWNPMPTRSGGLAEAMAELTSRGGQVLRADKDAPVLTVGRATMRFLNDPWRAGLPGRGLGSSNNLSVVCRLEFGEISFLFVGDLEHAGEQSLIATGRPLRATVLKVGHHGCKTSTSEEFVRAVSPSAALISCDANPWSTCPDQQVMSRLESAGARIFWAGRDGAVAMETDGNTLWVRTGKNSLAREEVVAPRGRPFQREYSPSRH